MQGFLTIVMILMTYLNNCFNSLLHVLAHWTLTRSPRKAQGKFDNLRLEDVLGTERLGWPAVTQDIGAEQGHSPLTVGRRSGGRQWVGSPGPAGKWDLAGVPPSRRAR